MCYSITVHNSFSKIIINLQRDQQHIQFRTKMQTKRFIVVYTCTAQF